MKLKVTLLLAILLAFVSAVNAQKLTPITWDASVTANSTDNATVTISAKIEKGWHLYGFNLPDDGPNSTAIVLNLPRWCHCRRRNNTITSARGKNSTPSSRLNWPGGMPM